MVVQLLYHFSFMLKRLTSTSIKATQKEILQPIKTTYKIPQLIKVIKIIGLNEVIRQQKKKDEETIRTIWHIFKDDKKERKHLKTPLKALKIKNS